MEFDSGQVPRRLLQMYFFFFFKQKCGAGGGPLNPYASLLLCWLLFTDDCKLGGGAFFMLPFRDPSSAPFGPLWPLLMSLSLILHLPADQMFRSDADKRGKKEIPKVTQGDIYHLHFFVVLSHFLSRSGGWGGSDPSISYGLIFVILTAVTKEVMATAGIQNPVPSRT